ncbi:MAG: ribonuclease P protein component [Nitrosomonadales bacterium]|nr:ribonuclease P protein component [Nitrosomonadales bacterium]
MRAAVSVLACELEEILTLPRRFRLSRREGFSRILQQRAQTKSWFAVHSESNSSGHARLGMSVSKRVIPAATQRNIAKRLIRECFRKCARQGIACDVVIRLRKPLDKKNLAEARTTLNEMLKTVLAAK